LAHHDDELSDDDRSVQSAVNEREFFLKHFDRVVIQAEVSESPVVVVEQDSCWHILANNLLHFSDFLCLDVDSLDRLGETSIFVVEANFNLLLAEDLVSMLAERLSDLERGELAVLLLVLSNNLVDTLCL